MDCQSCLYEAEAAAQLYKWPQHGQAPHLYQESAVHYYPVFPKSIYNEQKAHTNEKWNFSR